MISQPASPEPEAPFVIPWSAGDQSTSAALTETANAILSNETGEPAGDPGPLTELMRLAIPTGLGEQGPVIESGLDAVRISSTGELPLPPERDTAEEVDFQSLGNFGRAALSLVLALDTAPSPVEHGPDAYVGVAGNLLPGLGAGDARPGAPRAPGARLVRRGGRRRPQPVAGGTGGRMGRASRRRRSGSPCSPSTCSRSPG